MYNDINLHVSIKRGGDGALESLVAISNYVYLHNHRTDSILDQDSYGPGNYPDFKSDTYQYYHLVKSCFERA